MRSARTMSVVVPAYNEMGNLENAVKDVVHALRTFDDYEERSTAGRTRWRQPTSSTPS